MTFAGKAGGTSLTHREDFDSIFFRRVPILAGLVLARVGLSFSYFFFPYFSATVFFGGQAAGPVVQRAG
jgi:hypothetical protein